MRKALQTIPTEKLNLIFGIAYNLPIAWEEKEIEYWYQTTLLPFAKVLYRVENIRVTLYIPGHLLAWLNDRHAEYIQVLRELATAKRIELLGGGYYDPIFSLLPQRDIIEQIEYTSAEISRLFKKRPYGMWINGLDWQLSHISAFSKCDVRYSFLCDIDMIKQSRADTIPPAPVNTEYEGNVLTIFPLHGKIFDAWRDKRHHQILDTLATIHSAPTTQNRRIVALIDDSSRHMGHKYIEKWFALLKKAERWIETVCPNDLFKVNIPLARYYFYSRRQCGIELLSDNYSQRARLYAKMQFTRAIAHQIRGDKQRKQLAINLVLQSQNHFGYRQDTLPINHLEQLKKSYQFLIEAERIAHQQRSLPQAIRAFDIDYDGLDEYIFQSKQITAVTHRRGGALVELSYLRTLWALLDTIAEDGSYEGYSAEPNHAIGHLDMRACFIDHVISTQTSAYTFLHGKRQPNSLIDLLYHSPRVNREHNTLELQATWEAMTSAIDAIIDIRKKYYFKDGHVGVDYLLDNNSIQLLNAYFGSQLNLIPTSAQFDKLAIHCAGQDGKIYKYDSNFGRIHLNNITSILLERPKKRLRVEIDCAGADKLWLYSFPKYKVITLVPLWKLYLGPHDQRSLRVEIKLTDRRTNRSLTGD